MKPKFWLHDLRGIEIYDSPRGHWGRGQTGFTFSQSGRINLSDGRKIKTEEGWKYPCHRDLISGEGKDRTVFSGIYSYGYPEGPTLWLYPDAEQSLNDDIRHGLCSLIGVHRIDSTTRVVSNTTNELLFILGDVQSNPS